MSECPFGNQPATSNNGGGPMECTSCGGLFYGVGQYMNFNLWDNSECIICERCEAMMYSGVILRLGKRTIMQRIC